MELNKMNYNDIYNFIIDSILEKDVDIKEIIEALDVLLNKFEMGPLERSMLKSFKLTLQKNEKPYYDMLFNLSISFASAQTFYHNMDDPVILYKTYLNSRRF